ncbi:hypothetical protein BIV59_04850 [Bacillus sp. MUM 13]|nr:hypothetical protein BIV59_04850 [Bacillus sp. MUM 13]
MLNRSFSYVVYGIIALGFIGLFSKLAGDPLGFFKTALIWAAVAGAVYLIYKRLTKGKLEKKEQRAFIKAARKSKKRLKSKNSLPKDKGDNIASFSLAKSSAKKRARKKSEAHLTVIEGKKNKKRNRALF